MECEKIMIQKNTHNKPKSIERGGSLGRQRQKIVQPPRAAFCLLTSGIFRAVIIFSAIFGNKKLYDFFTPIKKWSTKKPDTKKTPSQKCT